VARENRGDRVRPVAQKKVEPKKKAKNPRALPPEIVETSGTLTPGAACTRKDRDPLKCMACVIKGEDDKSSICALAVAANVQERVAKQFRGRNVCEVIHWKKQYSGAWGFLPEGSGDIAWLEKVAKAGLNVQGNGMLGFRSYYRKGSTKIGDNYYTHRAEDEGLKEQIKENDDRFDTAELQTGTAVN
jgi:hypothetical protein